MLSRSATPTSAARQRRRGLSLVELMVGITVGMLVVAGGLSLSARNLGNSKRLLAEARFNQDLRAAADLISRDLRRTGYWGNAILGTRAIGTSSVTAKNPYYTSATAAYETGPGTDGFTYRFSRDATENDALDANEQFRFRVSGGALQMQQDAQGWMDVTDPKVLKVATNGLVITPSVTTLALGHLCPKLCAAGTPNCPTTTVRSYAVTLTASSVVEPSLVRTLQSTVRLRNDQLAGYCPA